MFGGKKFVHVVSLKKVHSINIEFNDSMRSHNLVAIVLVVTGI